MSNRTTIPRQAHWVRDEVEALLPVPDDVLVVDDEPIPSGRGWWSPEHRVILLRPDLRGAERHVTLAHETAHALLGHHSGHGPGIELEADRVGEVLLLGAARDALRRSAVGDEVCRRAAR